MQRPSTTEVYFVKWFWSTEKKCMSRYKRTSDIFFGIEHRMRKEEMEEQFNRETKR